jgi:hypothetical protein
MDSQIFNFIAAIPFIAIQFDQRTSTKALRYAFADVRHVALVNAHSHRRNVSLSKPYSIVNPSSMRLLPFLTLTDDFPGLVDSSVASIISDESCD